MRRDPTEEETRRIKEAVFAGDQFEATMIYLSIAKCGLTEAQGLIKKFTSELQESMLEKFGRKR